jgi:hypothetical protein
MRASFTAQYFLFQEQEPRSNELRARRLTSTTLFQSMRGRPRTLALQEATALRHTLCVNQRCSEAVGKVPNDV